MTYRTATEPPDPACQRADRVPFGAGGQGYGDPGRRAGARGARATTDDRPRLPHRFGPIDGRAGRPGCAARIAYAFR